MRVHDEVRGLANEQAQVVDAASDRLTYVNDSEPGITRKPARSTGFNYTGPDGKPIKDEETLDRIRKLAIPPAYTDVWISADPDGHIQATGRDAKGRKQYRYHPQWTALQAETKFARMAAFGRALPKIRKRIEADLKKRGLPREKVLATVVDLLELTRIRVGNDEYAKQNKSFGLTTLRNKHAKVKGETLKFEFQGKSGVKHATSLRDRRLARIVKQCQDLPGQRLFQWVDADGARHAVTSGDVNAYLKEVTGEDYTAKDFRTWAGTVAAAKALALQPAPTSATDAKRLIATCVKATAGLLGNTPAVCRSAYIHPGVIEAFADGRLPKRFAKADGPAFERAMLKWLDDIAAATEQATGITVEKQEKLAA